MKKAIVTMCVLGLLVWAVPAMADTWQGGDATNPNDWDTNANWVDNSVPLAGDSVVIENGVVYAEVDALTVGAVCSGLTVGTGVGNGDLRLNNDLRRGDFNLGTGGGTGVVTQNSGTFGATDIGWAWFLAADGGTGTATFNLTGGTSETKGQARLGSATDSVATVNQSGGVFNMTNAAAHFELNKSRGLATYNISGGTMAIRDFLQTSWWGHGEAAGADAVFNISNTDGVPNITFLASDSSGDAWSVGGDNSGVSNNNNATVTAVTGTVVHMQGNFENRLGFYVNDPTKGDDETDTAGLNNITLQFEHTDAVTDTLEVAGEDLGAVLAGLNKNYALEGLTLGGNIVGGGYQAAKVQLGDVYDNQKNALAEALYVNDLVIGAGSTLDLNGLNVYYDGTFPNNGTVTDSVGGGGIYYIPEPATMVLLGLGGIGVLIRRKRR